MDATEFEQMLNQQEAWDNSPEGVRYNLHMFVDDMELERIIVHTVCQLPLDVQLFLYEWCRFAAVGNGIKGQVLPPSERWLILLDAGIVADFSEDAAMGIVAHEIAHAVLGHNQLDPTITAKVEIDAAALAQQWGFIGIGADEKHVRALYQHSLEPLK